MLGIPGFRRGTDTEMKINFSGEMTGARANVFLEPRKDGPTTIKMRFHELKEAPAGRVYVLWAVSPDNKFVRLGQIVNTGQRNEAQIQTETALQDFGLFITLEEEASTPTGTVVGTVIK
jgi:anti-sigma-K factor RskA